MVLGCFSTISIPISRTYTYVISVSDFSLAVFLDDFLYLSLDKDMFSKSLNFDVNDPNAISYSSSSVYTSHNDGNEEPRVYQVPLCHFCISGE